eukprot:s963_g13.t1
MSSWLPGAVDGTKPIIKTECSADPAVEIGPKDLKTSIELRVDPEGNPVLPSLQPQPDLSFDRKILRAYIMQPGMETFRPQKSISSEDPPGLHHAAGHGDLSAAEIYFLATWHARCMDFH